MSSDGSTARSLSCLEMLSKELQSIVDLNRLPGYAFAVLNGTDVIYSDCYGKQDLDRDTPLSMQTSFRMFSMTKPLAAAALMTFYDEGKVSLDDTVSKFLGDAWKKENLKVAQGSTVSRGEASEPVSWTARSCKQDDFVFLFSAELNAHIDADNQGICRCRWNDAGDWQALKLAHIECIGEGTWRAVLQAHTDLYLDVVDGQVIASSTTPVFWIMHTAEQADLSKEQSRLRPGTVVRILHEPTGQWLCIEGCKESVQPESGKPAVNGVGGLVELASSNDRSVAICEDSQSALRLTVQLQIWELMGLEVPRQDITIRHLLTHTSGFDYAGLEARPRSERSAIYKNMLASCERGDVLTLEAWCNEVVKLPLACHPGERFQYGFSIDILGCVLEVLGNSGLDEVIYKQLTGPLKMNSTRFDIDQTSAKQHLACLYEIKSAPKLPSSDGSCSPNSKQLQKPTLRDDASNSLWTPPRVASIFGAGGGVETLRGGLLSTVPDYLRFCSMLMNGGELDGCRVLKADTVKMMLQVNHFGLILNDPLATTDKNGTRGFGLLGSLELSEKSAADNPLHWPGRFGWGGWAGTQFRILPEPTNVGIVFMTNCIGWDVEQLLHRRLGEAASCLQQPCNK